MRENISIGLLGLGVVGSGVIKLIHDHQEELVHQIGCDVSVDRVLVRNIEKARNTDVNPEFLTTNVEDVINNPNIDVIVEVMGGIEQRSEEHTSELQSRFDLVCRLLLEKKK